MTLPEYLERALSRTNPSEFVNGRIRATTHNVKKWNGGEMAMRWVTAALFEASKTFCKLRGYKDMPPSSPLFAPTINSASLRPPTHRINLRTSMWAATRFQQRTGQRPGPLSTSQVINTKGEMSPREPRTRWIAFVITHERCIDAWNDTTEPFDRIPRGESCISPIFLIIEKDEHYTVRIDDKASRRRSEHAIP